MSWLVWAATNLLLFALVVTVGSVVIQAGHVLASGGSERPFQDAVVGNAMYAVVYGGALMIPAAGVHLAILAAAAGMARGRAHRAVAVATSPLIGVPIWLVMGAHPAPGTFEFVVGLPLIYALLLILSPSDTRSLMGFQAWDVPTRILLALSVVAILVLLFVWARA